MAITSYATLKSAVESRINIGGQTTAIEDAVQAATGRLSRELRVVDQEDRATANLTTEYSALPSDFNGMRALRDGNNRRLEYYAPESFQTMVERYTYLDKPIYTIEEQKLRVHPAPTTESPLAVTMLYHVKVTDLAAADDSNWVLQDHSDLYLAASMVEINLHLKDKDAAAMWDERYKQLAEQVIVASRRKRYTSGQLVIRTV